ncbi:MAG TPA: maltose alpha-D-glucosyltransferase [Vicinamibacterales bacterium]
MSADATNLSGRPAVVISPAPADDPSLWYKDAIIYQAHVKSFFDSNQDGIGDFPGLTQKLDYLASLGINCLWLLPFFPSPLKDDGYDIADYLNIHPSYGTLSDFKAFVEAAHARGIRVLIELVVNHTSDQHPWFQRARRAPRGSPERNFYVWSDSDKSFPETRIIFLDTEKSNWAFDPVAGQYYWHRFFSHQPDLNHNNPAVVQAVIDVMKFWLDLGVDALRLDAVPYLCVREGTNNENLPETHAVLRQMRRALDASYKGRMLLAEANQWPSDVRPYFGDGDECHMAFHFPLMPRMFMALRQEDRHAITEILSQTPDIPENCQWALFLRNHDELTLEMVTDEERDYMYQVYAADPRMRLNLGIRRRLAPLVENSRRRVELLQAMLFSFPGTPVVYYGDEIGMGDNVYLGDRNGVRTPMQWSSDRNGGFSRADAARLYAPPIQDPVYGFQAINVEAQERYPFSQLNWMKRLIAMRKQHRVFGRGAIEFVGCPNRKILAYLRRDERETMLCVVNLARAVQPAELDLRAFAGLIPVEMIGMTEFPRIGQQPYFLTLGPYAFYWFQLRREPMQMAPRATETTDPNAAIVDALPALLVGVDWQTLLDSGTKTIIEQRALVPFLQRQRWFASKTREVRRARFTDWSRLRGGQLPSFLTVVSLEYSDGWTESYFVPLALVADDHAKAILTHRAASTLARITGARKGVILDGFQDDDMCDALLGTALNALDVKTSKGTVHGVVGRLPASGGAAMPSIGVEPERKWTRPTADQSNSLAFVNEKLVLKLFRRIEPSINPEYEIGRTLTEAGFPRIPPLVGALEYLRPGLETGTLGIVQGAIKNQGTAWDFALNELRRFYERISARGRRAGAREAAPEAAEASREGPGAAPFFTALANYALQNAELLGRRTADMHIALATVASDAFKPEPMTVTSLQASAESMTARVDGAFDLLARRERDLDAATRDHARAVLASRSVVRERFRALRTVESLGARSRIHGDYHLGQVLRAEEDFIILDFEGEPDRSIADRRSKQSPVKDVAGMVRSFSYAAYAALFAFVLHAPEDFGLLAEWADAWQRSAADAFVRGYRDALELDGARSGLVPRGASWNRMLQAFVLEKALYELAYELNYRPEWVQIPLLGIRKLIDGRPVEK